MIVYTEKTDVGLSIHFVPDEVAIALGRIMARRQGMPVVPDKVALMCFQSGRLDLDYVVNVMAQGMFMDTYQVGPERWPDAEQASWRKQARAALKALGVVLPS